jgi:hypothetical protein
MHERDVGGIRVVRPASGMVAFLEPIDRATGAPRTDENQALIPQIQSFLRNPENYPS